MSNVTLIVIPGPGARTATVTPSTTVSQFVSSNNLSGRDIIINGVGIPQNTWETHVVPANAEVFATASVKGNASRPSNGPSQTGRPSGGGRGNNPPKGK